MTEWSLSPSAYRRFDAATKLLGLALVAAGLEVGGGSALGLGLAAVGTACATITVFINNE